MSIEVLGIFIICFSIPLIILLIIIAIDMQKNKISFTRTLPMPSKNLIKKYKKK
jgi:hypothetical protein